MLCFLDAPFFIAHQMPMMFVCCALMMLLSFAVFVILDHCTAGKNNVLSVRKEKAWAAYVMLLLMFVCLIIWLHIFSGTMLQATDDSLLQVSGNGIYIAFSFEVIFFAMLLTGSIERGNGTAGKIALASSLLFTALMVFLYSYIPNLLNQPFFVEHHYTAVEQTIYNVAFNVPFTRTSSGVYGHYAIILWPLLKLFGHAPQTITWFFVAGNIFILCLFLLIVRKLTSNYILQAMAVLALCGRYVKTYNLMQVFPNRLIWPLVILTYLIYRDSIQRHMKKPRCYYALGYVLCAIAITWSTDSGLAATLAYTISLWILSWRDEFPFSRKALKLYCATGAGFVCAILGMVLLINIYNLLCGGQLIFKECFYPAVGGEGYLDLHLAPMPLYGYSWLFPTVVFVGSICLGVLSCSFIRVGNTNRLPFAFCGLMGLGQSYYFFNRSLGSWAIVVGYFVFCIIALAEEGISSKKRPASMREAIKRAVGMASIVYLCVFVVNTFYTAPDFLSTKLGTGIYKMDSMEDLATSVTEEIPKDTYAFGYFTQDVYAYLGWDPEYHHKDVSDFTIGEKDAIDEIVDELNSQDRLLVSVSNTGLLGSETHFVLLKSIPSGNPVFNYYENLNAYAEKSMSVEGHGMTVGNATNGQLVAFPFTIERDTVYKVDITLGESTDFNDVAQAWLIVDFYGQEYDRGEQEMGGFTQDGKYNYTFYFNSGDVGGDALDGYVRMFTAGVPSKQIPVETLRVTEMEHVG